MRWLVLVAVLLASPAIAWVKICDRDPSGFDCICGMQRWSGGYYVEVPCDDATLGVQPKVNWDALWWEWRAQRLARRLNVVKHGVGVGRFYCHVRVRHAEK